MRPRTIRPGCELGVLLQNLIIDAHDPDELELRLHAIRSGRRDEGLHLTLPVIEPRLLRYLGPRFTPDTVARLRRVACSVAAGALTLALATDADAPWLAAAQVGWTHPHGHHVRAYTGTFRIPPQARPLLWALLVHRAARPGPPEALLVDRDGQILHGRRIAHLVDAAAELAGLPRLAAARACENRYTAENIAGTFTGATTIDELAQPARSDAPADAGRHPGPLPDAAHHQPLTSRDAY